MLDLSRICDLHQSSQQCWILNHWAGRGIQPTSSWILVWFLTAEPQQELLNKCFWDDENSFWKGIIATTNMSFFALSLTKCLPTGNLTWGIWGPLYGWRNWLREVRDLPRSCNQMAELGLGTSKVTDETSLSNPNLASLSFIHPNNLLLLTSFNNTNI